MFLYRKDKASVCFPLPTGITSSLSGLSLSHCLLIQAPISAKHSGSREKLSVSQSVAAFLLSLECSVSYIRLIKSTGHFINKLADITVQIWHQFSRTFNTLSQCTLANHHCYPPESWFLLKKLQRNQPILDFLCNIQSKWLKQNHGPKFKMVLHWVSLMFIFIFLVGMCCYRNHRCATWDKTTFPSSGWGFSAIPPLYPPCFTSDLGEPWKSLCKQIKVLYSTGLFVFLNS